MPLDCMQESVGQNCGKGGPELLDDVQSQHYMEQQSATLMVTVLEACGMQPRKGAALLSRLDAHACPWSFLTTRLRVRRLPIAFVLRIQVTGRRFRS